MIESFKPEDQEPMNLAIGIMKKLILCLSLTGFILLFISCTQNKVVANKVYPDTEWEEKSPESLGVDPVVLDSALGYFRKYSGGAGTDEMMVIRNGYVIWKGPDVNHYHEIFSCTKVFTSTVMGVLVTKGRISVDDFVVDYFPELDDGDEGQKAYSKVRFRDLATMSAGYQGIYPHCWDLTLKGLHDSAYACTQTYTIPGKPQYESRTHISYRDANVHMLGYVLTMIAGRSLEDVFRENIAGKIGMTNWDWSDYGKRDGMFFNNPAGTPNNMDATEMNEVQCGIWTTASELAKLGLLYLYMGEWKGERVLDSAFTTMAISNQVPAETPAIGVDLAGRYGYYWWTNGIRKDGTRPWPSAPPKASTPHGGSRNFCFVIPEWNMVIVRTSPRSKGSIPQLAEPTWAGFFEILKEGIVYTP